MNSKRIIGRYEYVCIPELNMINVPAKIDTGAYGTSIHCDRIIDNGDTVTFDLNGQSFTLPIIKRKNVKSSNCESSIRICIEADVILGDVKKRSVISLTNRGDLKFQILIGRKFLKNGFIIDVSKTYKMRSL
jgi:hypothetical protein